MTEEKVKGIVLKLIDYKDADKLASVFTLEQGIVLAKFVGVKKDKAKMKAIAQPFVFAEFSFNKKNNKRTVVSANLIDNFPGLLNSYDKTMCGYVMLDMLSSILPQEKVEQSIFLLSLTSLKEIEDGNAYVALIKFIIKFFEFSGMGIVFPDKQYVHFDRTTGEFVENGNFNTMQLDKKVFETLVAIKNEELIEVNIATLKQILRLLHSMIFIKFNEDIKSFEFI